MARFEGWYKLLNYKVGRSSCSRISGPDALSVSGSIGGPSQTQEPPAKAKVSAAAALAQTQTHAPVVSVLEASNGALLWPMYGVHGERCTRMCCLAVVFFRSVVLAVCKPLNCNDPTFLQTEHSRLREAQHGATGATRAIACSPRQAAAAA